MNRKRIVFVQAGNYAEAVKRFEAGGEEDYYAQRYSVDFVGRLAQRGDVEEIIQVCFTEELEEERLSNGIRQVGLVYRPEDGPARNRELIDLVFAQRPSHLIVSSPITPLIRTARRRGVDVYPLLADSFRVSGIKAQIRYRWFAHNLRHRDIRWVTNHNVNASRDLERIGVPPAKIVPFDWPAVVSPADFEIKTGPADPQAPRLLYVGQVRIDKGVGDLIDALASMNGSGRRGHLTIIGTGEVESLGQRAADLGVAADVEFRGRVSHAEVMKAMHDHDIVLVPSHHEYPEGLPSTIYEGLCSRTPLVVSDHPMFSARVANERDCLVFPARNVEALVAAIERLLQDRELYATFSKHADEACANFMVCAPWGELLERWLGGTPEDDAWLADHALTAPRFNP